MEPQYFESTMSSKVRWTTASIGKQKEQDEDKLVSLRQKIIENLEENRFRSLQISDYLKKEVYNIYKILQL